MPLNFTGLCLETQMESQDQLCYQVETAALVGQTCILAV